MSRCQICDRKVKRKGTACRRCVALVKQGEKEIKEGKSLTLEQWKAMIRSPGKLQRRPHLTIPGTGGVMGPET